VSGEWTLRHPPAVSFLNLIQGAPSRSHTGGFIKDYNQVPPPMDCTWWLVCALLPAAVTFYKPGREPTIRLLPSFNCRVLTGRDDSKEEGKKPISGPQKNTKRPHWKVKKMITYLCPRIWGVLKTFNPQIQGHWRLSSLLLFLSSYYRQLVAQRLGSCGQEVKEDTRLTIIMLPLK